jgi:hypothetical protein
MERYARQSALELVLLVAVVASGPVCRWAAVALVCSTLALVWGSGPPLEPKREGRSVSLIVFGAEVSGSLAPVVAELAGT